MSLTGWIPPDTAYRVVSGRSDLMSVGDIVSVGNDSCLDNWTACGTLELSEVSLDGVWVMVARPDVGHRIIDTGRRKMCI